MTDERPSLLESMRGDEVPKRVSEWEQQPYDPTPDELHRTVELDPAFTVVEATAHLCRDTPAQTAYPFDAERPAPPTSPPATAETHVYAGPPSDMSGMTVAIAPTVFDGLADATARVDGYVVVHDEAVVLADPFARTYDLRHIDSLSLDTFNVARQRDDG